MAKDISYLYDTMDVAPVVDIANEKYNPIGWDGKPKRNKKPSFD